MSSISNTLRFIANHPLTAGHKWSAYARFLKWQIESRLCSEVEYDWIGGAKLVARNGMTGATGNIYCGLQEFKDMAFLLHLLRPNDLFVDIGANIGSYTVLASAVCNARSIAVEPDPSTARSLFANVKANGIEDRVQVIEAALGSTSGRARFTTDLDTMNQVTGSFSGNTRQVNMTTLDTVLKNEKPTLIKMDVEGYEPEVILGAEKSITIPSVLAIITENAEPRVRSVLENAGFRISQYEPFSRTLSLMGSKEVVASGNTLFVRDLGECIERIKKAPTRRILQSAL